MYWYERPKANVMFVVRDSQTDSQDGEQLRTPANKSWEYEAKRVENLQQR